MASLNSNIYCKSSKKDSLHCHALPIQVCSAWKMIVRSEIVQNTRISLHLPLPERHKNCFRSLLLLIFRSIMNSLWISFSILLLIYRELALRLSSRTWESDWEIIIAGACSWMILYRESYSFELLCQLKNEKPNDFLYWTWNNEK